MTAASLEHLNLTVEDPKATARRLCDLFGWRIRWEGPALAGGYTVHVGTDTAYLAVYSRDGVSRSEGESYLQIGGLNHVGVVVDDIDAVEARVLAAGLETHSHASYDPGRRFYFDDPDGVEFEVVSYA